MNGEERLRVTEAATLHAGQLLTLQDELRVRYAPDFFDRLSLELERQTRLNLIQALPERAEEIRKAHALAYFFTTLK